MSLPLPLPEQTLVLVSDEEAVAAALLDGLEFNDAVTLCVFDVVALFVTADEPMRDVIIVEDRVALLDAVRLGVDEGVMLLAAFAASSDFLLLLTLLVTDAVGNPDNERLRVTVPLADTP